MNAIELPAIDRHVVEVPSRDTAILHRYSARIVSLHETSIYQLTAYCDQHSSKRSLGGRKRCSATS